jgi:hypothetical protein
MQQSIARRTRELDESSGSIDPVQKAQLLGEIAARQARILELGSKLADKISGGTPSPSGAPTIEPDGDGERPESGNQEKSP